jgi:hypothetical protein
LPTPMPQSTYKQGQGSGRVCEKNRPKCSTTHFLQKLMHNQSRGKSHPKMRATYVSLKAAKSKQSPIGQKFSQSGHNAKSIFRMSLRFGQNISTHV